MSCSSRRLRTMLVAAIAAMLVIPASAAFAQDGEGGILGGNQVIAPITAPITACGNAVGLLGKAAPVCKAVVGGG